jgi:hypothetical protein
MSMGLLVGFIVAYPMNWWRDVVRFFTCDWCDRNLRVDCVLRNFQSAIVDLQHVTQERITYIAIISPLKAFSDLVTCR